MKKAKKMVSAFLCIIIVMTAGLATGCKDTVANDPNTLEIAIVNSGYGTDWLDALAKKFEEKNEGVNVVWNPIPKFASQSQVVSLLGNRNSTSVDLYFNVQSDIVEYIVNSGDDILKGEKCAIESINDVYEADIDGIKFKDKMFDSFENAYRERIDGEDNYYSMSWATSAVSLVANKTELDKISTQLPRTTDELIELSQKIKAANKTPFVFAASVAYWNYAFYTFWAQYQGVEEFDNYFAGIDNNQYSKNIFKQQGRLEALNAIESLISYDIASEGANDFIHNNVNTMNFSVAQANLLLGDGLMQPNGDWFEKEMSESIDDGIAVGETVIMKMPMVSAITDRLENKSMTDLKLRQVIDYVDGITETKPTEVSDGDLEIIRNARNIVFSSGNAHNTMIPKYSTSKSWAKEFLKYMATDEALEIYMENTLGGCLPFEYDFDKSEKGKQVYSGLSTFQKEKFDMMKDAEFIPFNKTTLSYLGGLDVLVVNPNPESLFTSKNLNDRKSAKAIFDAEINYWTDSRWDNLLLLANVKV